MAGEGLANEHPKGRSKEADRWAAKYRDMQAGLWLIAAALTLRHLYWTVRYWKDTR